MATNASRIGNWKLLRELGSGSYGTVYEAQHVSITGSLAAIKILHQKISTDPIIKSRFLKEASAASLAHHENIVQVFDSGISEDGTCYIIMELIQGTTLTELLSRERLTVPRVVGIGVEIAKALQAAHQNGIIHRDIKPDNVFVMPRPMESCRIKLVDFGVAKFLDDLGATVQTKTGTWVGTRSYMSPEQWKSPAEIDGRADIYSLGIILYECLTGHLPFKANTDYEWLIAHTEHPVPDPGRVAPIPAMLSELVRQMLAKERAHRPATMQDVVGKLEQCLSVQAVARPSFAIKIQATQQRLSSFALVCSCFFLVSPCSRPTNNLLLTPVVSNGSISQSQPIPALPTEMVVMGPGTLLLESGSLINVPQFAIGKFEVSISDFKEFHDAEIPLTRTPWHDVRDLEAVLLWPATGISQSEAVKYCQWKYRRWQGGLPNEDEWEFAAHSGQADHRYPWPGDFDWRKVHARQTVGADFLPVNSLPAGATDQGLLHMLGNASEWTASNALPLLQGAIVRGGNARDQSEHDLTGRKLMTGPDAYVGFRCRAQPPRRH